MISVGSRTGAEYIMYCGIYMYVLMTRYFCVCRSRGGMALVHRHRIQLEGLLSDPELVVVFLLIYECSLPQKTAMEKVLEIRDAGKMVQLYIIPSPNSPTK